MGHDIEKLKDLARAEVIEKTLTILAWIVIVLVAALVIYLIGHVSRYIFIQPQYD